MADLISTKYYIESVLQRIEHLVDGSLNLGFIEYADGRVDVESLLLALQAIQDISNDVAYIRPEIVALNSNYIALTALFQYILICNASTGDITITLPAVAGRDGQTYQVKKIDGSGSRVIIEPQSGELIDGDSSAVISYQYDAVTVICDGASWHIF